MGNSSPSHSYATLGLKSSIINDNTKSVKENLKIGWKGNKQLLQEIGEFLVNT